MNTQLNKKIKKSFLLIAMVLLLPSLLLAGGSKRGEFNSCYGERDSFRPHHKIWENQQLVETLGLNENQVKLLKEMDFTAQEKGLKLKSELDILQLSMKKAFSQDSPNQTEILELAKKISDLKGQGFVQRITFQLKYAEILTPDQLKMLKGTRSQFMGKHKGGQRSQCGKSSSSYKR